jgi:hypothetical protein
VVNSAAKPKKSGTIALIVDERLTRERRGALSRVVTSMRQYATVQVLAGEVDEEQLIWKLQKERFDLVLAPWYRYLDWTKVEAHFGLTRASGPTFAGYASDPIDPSGLGPTPSHLRTMIFDFAETHPHEAALLVRSLLEEGKRTGIRPLLDPTSTIYCENWYQAQGLGSRTDVVLALPELAQAGWLARAPSIRLVLSALWGLVYEEGSGKSELNVALNQALAQSTGNRTPRAYFQVGCDFKTLAFRLCYSMPGSTAKNALANFWPDPLRPTAASQLLLKYADFLRVHTIADGQEIELTTGLFQSGASQKAHRRLHSFWVEPVLPALVAEIPFEAPGPDSRHLKALPSPAVGKTESPAETQAQKDARERFVFEAAVKIRELKKQIEQRDERIDELRRGGVGTAAPLPPPDAEGLIEAFQQRYFEARHQIRCFEAEIAEMEKSGATEAEVETLRQKMQELAKREQGWILQLAKTLKDYKAVRQATLAKKASGDGSE